MAMGNKKPQEVKLVGKVMDFVTNIYPNELKKASKEFQKMQGIKLNNEAYKREFFSMVFIKERH